MSIKTHTNLQRSKQSQVTQEELQLPLLLPLSLLNTEEDIDARGLTGPSLSCIIATPAASSRLAIIVTIITVKHYSLSKI